MQRIVSRNGRFEELESGRPFSPIGFHFIRFKPPEDPSGPYHYVIYPGLYDSDLVKGVLFNLGMHGFNVLRIFIGRIDLGDDGRVGHQTLQNLTDLLRHASSYGVYVILETVTGLAGGVYSSIASQNARGDVGGPQAFILDDSQAHARGEFLFDLLNGVKTRDPEAFNALFSVELYNELPIWPYYQPFSLTSGQFEYRDRTYDMSNPTERLDLIVAGVEWSTNVIVERVRQVDPNLMVAFSTLPPRTRGRTSDLDNMPSSIDAGCGPGNAVGCFPVPARSMISASVSYIDVHYIDPLDLSALEWDDLRNSRKPILCGEIGQHHMPDKTARQKVDWLLEQGVSGVVFWDYDRHSDRGTGLSAMTNDGAVFKSLAPTQKTRFLVSSGTTVAYSNGKVQAAFLSPDHERMYRQVFGNPVSGEPSGESRGLMPIPEGYLWWQSTRYYSFGNGRFIGFLNPEAYANHRTWFPHAPLFRTTLFVGPGEEPNPDHPSNGFELPPSRFMQEVFPPYSSYPPNT